MTIDEMKAELEALRDFVFEISDNGLLVRSAKFGHIAEYAQELVKQFNIIEASAEDEGDEA